MASLALEAHLPLRFSPGALAPELTQAAMQTNAILLSALERMETAPREAELESPLVHELARVEAKVDLALTLLARFLSTHSPLPTARRVFLGLEQLSWEAPEPEAGGVGVVELWLSPAVPLPLTLPVDVWAWEAGLARARYQHLSEAVAEALTRTLFRHHRRSLKERGLR